METAFSAESEIVGAAVDGHRRAARPAVARRLYPLLSGN